MTQLSPYDMEYFDQIRNQVDQINLQLKHIDHFQRQRQNKFTKSMNQYQKYLQNQRKALQKNTCHSKIRNQWFQQEIKKAWQISISNRNLVLRSLARTNVLKKDADQWLARIEDHVFAGEESVLDRFSRINDSYRQRNGDSIGPEVELKGSKLIDKYNEILRQYQYKI